MQPAAKAKKRQAADRADMPAKPKRPLSSYNLYSRFKRHHILEAFANGMPNTKGAVRALMAVPPGLEQHKDAGADSPVSPDAMQTLRRDNIRKDLELHLSPKDRDHRCDHQGSLNGNVAMSFAELAKLIAEYWGCIDVFSRSVFEQLAKEGREGHASRMKEYEDHPRSKRLKMYLPMPVSKEEKTEASTVTVAGTMIELAKTVVISPINPKKKISAKHSAAVQADLIDYLAKKNKPAKKSASAPQEVLVVNREIMEPISHIPITNRRSFVKPTINQGFTYSASDALPNPVGEIVASSDGGRTNDMLMSRIQDLEKSLEARRYHAHVREIEVELTKTRARERELQIMLSNLTCPTAFSAGCYPSTPHNNLVMQSGYSSRTGFVCPSLSGARQATASPRFTEHQYSYLPSIAFHYPAERRIALGKRGRRQDTTSPRFREPELNFQG